MNTEYQERFKIKRESDNEFMQQVINRETLQTRRLENFQKYNRLWKKF